MRRNQFFVRSTGDEWRERRPSAWRVEGIEPSLGKVRNARGELEAEQMGEREDMVADPSAVSVMDGDGEIGLVVEQAVDDVRRLAGRRDRDGVVGRAGRSGACRTAPLCRGRSVR